MICVPKSQIIYSSDGKVEEVVFFGFFAPDNFLKTSYRREEGKFFRDSSGGPNGLYDYSLRVSARSVPLNVRKIFELGNRKNVERLIGEGKFAEFRDMN
jgi:hypothetical protein